MPHRSRLDDMYGLQQGYGNNGSDGMMEKATIEKPPNLFGGRFPFLKCHMQR